MPVASSIVPGLCLLGIGGTPYISHKIMAQKPNFTFSTSSLKPPSDGASYYARNSLDLGQYNLLKL